MGKVYIGQDLRLTLIGNIDITGGAAKIQYKRGNDTPNEKNAEILNYETAECYADVNGTNITIPGVWKFWLKLIFQDTKIGYGEPVSIRFYNPGD